MQRQVVDSESPWSVVGCCEACWNADAPVCTCQCNGLYHGWGKTKKNIQSVRLTYELEWLDNVVQKCQGVMEQLRKETFKRYREIGKIILESGYRKGQWSSSHRKHFLEKLGISQQSFSRMVRLGEMSENRFTHAMSKFSSLFRWANQDEKKEDCESVPLHVAGASKPSPSMPTHHFDVVYADPPWRYNVRLRGTPEDHYSTMPLDELKKLEPPTTEDAVLFLWATNPMLQDALDLMESWGFKYKTNVAWVKNRITTGFYVRGQHELLLIGVKGKVHPPHQSNRKPSVIHAPSSKHSKKPEEAYQLIETMYPELSKIELFARKTREGWESWGDEIQRS